MDVPRDIRDAQCRSDGLRRFAIGASARKYVAANPSYRCIKALFDQFEQRDVAALLQPGH